MEWDAAHLTTLAVVETTTDSRPSMPVVEHVVTALKNLSAICIVSSVIASFHLGKALTTMQKNVDQDSVFVQCLQL